MEACVTTVSRVHLLRLDLGDDLRSCVERYAGEKRIVGAYVTALGAINNVSLGYYDLKTRAYDYPDIPAGDYELVSLVGNIASKDGTPFLHAHVAIGGRAAGLYGGHLFDARCAVTVEITITEFASPIVRSPCEEIGLAHWTFVRPA